MHLFPNIPTYTSSSPANETITLEYPKLTGKYILLLVIMLISFYYSRLALHIGLIFFLAYIHAFFISRKYGKLSADSEKLVFFDKAGNKIESINYVEIVEVKRTTKFIIDNIAITYRKDGEIFNFNIPIIYYYSIGTKNDILIFLKRYCGKIHNVDYIDEPKEIEIRNEKYVQKRYSNRYLYISENNINKSVMVYDSVFGVFDFLAVPIAFLLAVKKSDFYLFLIFPTLRRYLVMKKIRKILLSEESIAFLDKKSNVINEIWLRDYTAAETITGYIEFYKTCLIASDSSKKNCYLPGLNIIGKRFSAEFIHMIEYNLKAIISRDAE